MCAFEFHSKLHKVLQENLMFYYLILQVWGLDIHQLIVSFQGEHSKTTFFRNMGAASGVTQLAIGSGHNLFSCGVDGSMKFRALPERDSIVRYWSAS